MPDDMGGVGGSGVPVGIMGMSLTTILLIAGVYFAFIAKKKNKKIGYLLLLVWAWQSGIFSGLIPTAA